MIIYFSNFLKSVLCFKILPFLKRVVVSVFILAFTFSPVLPATNTFISKQLALKYPQFFNVPVAHAAGTKTKTIEFFVGQDQTSGTGVAAAANKNFVFTVDLPDAITSPTMIKSAWIDYTFQGASTAAPGVVTLGLTPSGFSETVFTSASYLSSTENYTIRVKPDFTAAMQAAMQTAGTKSITFRANVAGVPRKMENAKMFITYDYDDTAPTQITTIKYRIGQAPGNVAVGATGVTFTSPTMTVTENTPVVVSAWSEIRGHVPATGTVDSTFTVNYDADAVSNYYLDNAGSTDSQAIYILHPKTAISLNATHNLKVAATAGYQMNLVSAEQVLTYKFNYSASTLLMQTSEIMLGSDGNKASATPLDVLDTITLPENTISIKNVYLRGTGHAALNGTFGLAAQQGISLPTPVTNYAYTASTEVMNNFWVLSDDINDLGSMVQGDNVISATFTGTMSSRAAQAVITYSFPKTSPIQSGAATFWAEQQTAYGTTGTPVVNINIAGSPVSGSYRSYTWANSVNGVTLDRVASISVDPTPPNTYNWNSTGEYQWLLFFDKNLANEIVGNGAYTINLGSTGSNVMAAVEQVSWRYGAATTNIGNGTNPGNTIIAPSGPITDLDAFTLTTTEGTDTVTAVTVTLGPAGAFNNIAQVDITDNANLARCTAVTNPASNTIVFNTCTSNGGIPVTTGVTTYKVRITPKTHANMAVPPGAQYATTGTVTAFTSTNTQGGTDSSSATVTVDNLSPNGGTSVSGSPEDTANTLNWTTSSSADFDTTNGSVVLRWTSASAGAEVPVEGNSAYVAGNTIGTATVACVISSAVSTAETKIDGTGGSVGCTTTALTNGQAYTYKVFQRDTRGNYDVGVLIGTFTPILLISVTTYTNTTEPALDYSAACTTCGARIGNGAGFRQSITITGVGFGTVTAGNRSTATNNIKIGTHQIADANVTAWTPTSITFLTDSAIAGDTDTDWGVNFGGASALVVTAAGAGSTGKNFYIYPQITSVTQPVGFSQDTAREYDAGDTDGVITLNGTRFGSSQGSGSVTIVAQTGSVNSWTNTAIEVQVPTTIVDSVNTGSISMTQGTGTNSKTYTYINTLRILPRITGFTPASEAEGNPVTVNGNHFCQGVSCPASFSASNKVTFMSGVDATVFTSWSATAIVTAVPVGASTGNVFVTSNALTSNDKNFVVISNVPNAPTNLNQFTNAGLTNAISIGGSASSTPIYLTMTVANTGITGGTMYPQIEYKPIGTAFTCVAQTACGSAVEGLSAGAAPGPTDCSNPANNCSIAISPSDDVYHWQARIRFNKTAVDYYGPWISFDDVNPETATDFKIDTTPPAVTLVSSGSPGSNSATITWSTASELGSSRVEYNTTEAFSGGYNCAGTSECTALTDTSPMVNSHSVPLSNLGSGTTYYYRVRSMDTAGNETISTTYNFLTQAVTKPAKTTKSYINGATGLVSGATTYYFTVSIPETAPTIQNAYIEVFGVVSGGVGTVTVKANGALSRAYDVSATNPTFYRFLYQIPSPGTETNLNLNDEAPCSGAVVPGTPPLCNNIVVTPSGVSMYVLSSKILNTYSYTP